MRSGSNNLPALTKLMMMPDEKKTVSTLLMVLLISKEFSMTRWQPKRNVRKQDFLESNIP